MERELQLLWAAIAIYVFGGIVAIFGVVLGRRPERTVVGAMWLGLALHTGSIALRWARVRHGPFITMFEVLSSNVWSLMLAFSVSYYAIPKVRAAAAVVMPILFVMMGWLMVSHPGEGHFPPTYRTPLLYIHIGLGKVFLGSVLVAVGLAGLILLRRTGPGRMRLAALPDDGRLDELAFRFMALALIFESLMLVAGSIWAQDAWGRYWAWDPLETWAFLTWLCVAFTLHARRAFHVAPPTHAMMILTVFVVAFLTFFGVPFVTVSPHQGAI
jgi:ABC-type transport system involved in cytochrome c biogenesis permease subunit